jgi:periplasmic divalent cation tolerance protein
VRGRGVSFEPGQQRMAKQPVMIVYITASSRDEAMKLATALVEERLAACANIAEGMTSLFWWQGHIQREKEISLILKTRADLLDAMKARVRELHSYTVPCVVAWPIADGNEDFLDWVREQTRAP